MIIDKEYEHYRIPVAMDGNADFFHSNAVTKWNFINYFNGTHNELNKLKKYKKIKADYFDDLQKVYQSDVPEKIKEYILLLKSQEIPTRATIKANLAQPKNQQHVYNNSIFINGDRNKHITLNNNFYGSETSTGSSNNRSIKRPHGMEEDFDGVEKKRQSFSNEDVKDTEKKKDLREEETEKDSLWKKWVLFLRNPENIIKFHPFSPEYHGIIRCGKGVSWRPSLDSDLYKRHVDLHDEISYPLSNTVADYVSFVVNSPNILEFKKNLRQLPNVEDNVIDFLEEVLRSSYSLYSTIQDIEDGEAVFNDILLYPLLKAVCIASDAGVPQFKVGETQLRAMSKKTNESEIESDESTLYKADGIISLYGFNKVEVLLLETSGHFGSRDSSKSSFDHHKGLFGSLSMLKAIADKYSFGSLETFKNVKVFFVHAAEKTVRLWSMRHVPEGPLYELWLEKNYTINPSFDERAEQVPYTIKFYWSLKCLIDETAKNLTKLKQEHMKVVSENALTSSLPKDNLSTAINCSMLKLTEEEDKSGMFRLGPFYTAQ
ncbi:hypothetical protein G6F56_004025 [Rhizopus delemar]|nr:hypothetical protein G6F56_004025 [Rhizopus delemar]